MRRWITMAVLLLPATSAYAQGIVIESVVGQRHEDADYLLAPFRDELNDRGYLAQPSSVAARIQAHLSRRQEPLSKQQRKTAIDAIERGFREYREGNYGTAVELLRQTVGVLRRHPAAITSDSELKRKALRAYVGLALGYQREKRVDDARRTMAELIRSFPDHEISYAEYGPEPRKLYRQVENELTAEGRGTLEVSVDNANAAVIINERYIGIGNVAEKLYPGRYRIYAQLGDDVGRVHDVEVVPGETRSVVLSWTRDQTLHTSDQLVALVFEDEAARNESEARLALTIARGVELPRVVVVSIRPHRGRLAIIGTLLDAKTGKAVRAAALYADNAMPPASRIRALAGFLAGGEVGSDIEVLIPNAAMARDRHASASRPFRVWKWAALVSGVGVAATGAYLISIDGTGTCDSSVHECRDLYTTMTGGIVAVGAGVALIGTGVYLWTRDRKQGRRRTSLTILPSREGWSVTLQGRF